MLFSQPDEGKKEKALEKPQKFLVCKNLLLAFAPVNAILLP